MSTYFKVVKNELFNGSSILAVLSGEKLACMYNSMLSESSCKAILNNFYQHPLTIKREDIVPAYMAGAFHYGKSIKEYFDEVERYRFTMNEILMNERNFFQEMISNLRDFLQTKGITLRAAKHKNISVNPWCIRSAWSANSGEIILPHEDGAQLYDAKQHGFEIQDCITNYPILGVNVCIQDETDSRLIIWDTQPNQKIRKEFGLENTGYPYSLEYLKPFAKIEQEIKVGDTYFFNARHVHSVNSLSNKEGYRTTLSCFLAFLNDKTVIYWT